MTVVYSGLVNEKYKIYFSLKTNRFHWIDIQYDKLVINVGDELIKDFKLHQRFNLLLKDVARFKRIIFENLSSYLNYKGYSITIEYNKFNVNHCNTIKMRKY